MGSEPFSKLVHDSKARTKFISSAIKLIKKYGFDGLGNLLIKLRLLIKIFHQIRNCLAVSRTRRSRT